MKTLAHARRLPSWVALAVVLALVSCNVAEPPASTGGAPGTPCERFALVRSDWASTQVSLVDVRGVVTSANVVSSGTRSPGATAALSGDVVLPHDPPASGRLVLIDRYPNGIVTWIDPDRGNVVGQLNVVPGFPSNPHDYLEVAPDKAYVTRFETNRAGGKVPFDEGGDVLVIDPTRRTLTKRIDLSAFGGTVDPRPDRMTRAGGRVYLSLARLDATSKHGEDGAVGVVDVGADRIVDTIELPGLRNCSGLAVSADARSLAVACGGVFTVPSDAQLAGSGLVVVDVESKRERRRVSATTFGGPFSPSVGFAGPDHVIAIVYGDKVVSIDIPTGVVATLHQSRASFVLGMGEIACSCGNRCLVPDGEAPSLLAVDGTSASPLAALLGSTLPARAVAAIGLSATTAGGAP